MYIKSWCNGKLSNCAGRRVLTNTDWYTTDGAALSGSTVSIPNLGIQVNFDFAMTCGYWLMSQCPTLVPSFLWHILPNILAEKNFTSGSKLFKSNGKIRSLLKRFSSEWTQSEQRPSSQLLCFVADHEHRIPADYLPTVVSHGGLHQGKIKQSGLKLPVIWAEIWE